MTSDIIFSHSVFSKTLTYFEAFWKTGKYASPNIFFIVIS